MSTPPAGGAVAPAEAPRHRALSLRARLIAGLAFVAVVLAVVSIAVTTSISSQLMAEVDARLAAYSRGGRDDFGEAPGRPTEDGDRVSDAYQGFIGPDGTLTTLFRPNVGDEQISEPAIDVAALPEQGDTVFTTESVDGSVTYRVRADVGPQYTKITAIPIDDVQRTISRLIWVEAVGALAILAALAAVAWWVMHLGIRPLKRMAAAATEIADGDLSVRVPESAPGTEAGALAVALNRMLTTIQELLEERAASEERLRRFVADASHELRTPLTTIRGYSELYRHGGLPDDDAVTDAMRRIEQEASRMGRLVEDMLTLAKLDEQRPLSLRPVDLAALVNDAVADARASSPGRTITLDVEGSDGTGGQPTTLVLGDDDRLRQVLANVVGNALVHTADDVPIEVQLRTAGTDAVISVRDHGAGMPAEVAARVTERFFRADPARSRQRGGSGLGLSIAQGMVAAHGGTLSVESVTDAESPTGTGPDTGTDTGMSTGTTVTISLPLTPSVL